MRKLLLSAAFVAAGIGWCYLAIDNDWPIPVDLAGLAAIGVMCGRALDAVAFAVPLVPLLAFVTLGFVEQASFSDPLFVAILIVFVVVAGVAEAGVAIGAAWRSRKHVAQ
jgi:hypothetical protein